MNFIKIEGNNLIITDREDSSITETYDMTEVFGTSEVNSLENLDTGGNCMVDVIHLSNGKAICVSDESLCVYDTPKKYYTNWVEQEANDVDLEIEWYSDASLTGTEEHIKILQELIVAPMDHPSSIAHNYDLWENIIHPHMSAASMSIPFDKSFDEYNDWDDVPGGRFEFSLWIRSIMKAMGHKVYEETDDRIIVPGIGELVIDRGIGNSKLWVTDIQVATSATDSFDCGADFWYDYLPRLAAETDTSVEQLRYVMAQCNIMDKLYYDGNRWMPQDMFRVLQLCIAEDFKISEMQDKAYMNDKYEIWIEQGMI